MSDVLQLDEHRPHEQGPVICARCQHTWVAVRPVGVTHMECPNCGAGVGMSLLGLLTMPETMLGDECCGQTDGAGICAAPACLRGTALKLVDTIRLVYWLEHPMEDIE